MEENKIMKHEIKIMLPLYKIIYPILFVIFLAIFRGIADTKEIGVTLDPMLAVLSIVFMADTYLIEKREQRWEVFTFYSLDKKKIMIYERVFVQFVYLFVMAAIGYFLFFIQNPSISTWQNEVKMYFEYLFAVSISIIFFGIIAITFANLSQNIWCGIGVSLIIWLVLNSTVGDVLFGKYNIFSYVFRSYTQGIAVEWISGKVIGFILAILMIFVILPQTMKGRRRN